MERTSRALRQGSNASDAVPFGHCILRVLWDGRYKSSPVDTERYLLECSRYIELNPLRAGIVGRPEQYRWSSFGAKAGLSEDRPLHLDPCYLAMGETEPRQSCYAVFVSRRLGPSELTLIREALQRGQRTFC